MNLTAADIRNKVIRSGFKRAMRAGINPYEHNRVITYLKEAGIYPEDFPADQKEQLDADASFNIDGCLTCANDVSQHLRGLREELTAESLPYPRIPIGQACWECSPECRPTGRPSQPTWYW